MRTPFVCLAHAVIAAFCVFSATAQPSETLRIALNNPVPTQSSITLWRNVLYSITVRGRGSVGQVLQPATSVDARFFVNNLVFQSIQRPRMPLDANGREAEQYCMEQAHTLSTSPCLIFLAMNAIRTNPQQPAIQSPEFSATNAQQLRRFAFVPDQDNDTYSPNHAYIATLQGNNLPVRAVFVDRLGLSDNLAYLDNSDTLTAQIERISPELALLARPSFAVSSVQPARILNDERPQQLLRDVVIDFGSFRNGAATQTRLLVLINRGKEPLTIRVDMPNDPLGVFSVSSPTGSVAVQRVLNSGDSLPLLFRYTPRLQGTHSLDVYIATNDPALRREEDSTGICRIRLLGAGVSGILNVTGLNAPNTIIFPTLRAEAPTRNFSFAARIFNFSRASDVPAAFSIDSVVRTPGSPFISQAPDVLTFLPITIDAMSGAIFNPTMIFRPTRFGDFLDSLIFRGRNLEDYVLYLRGRAELADARIERLQQPTNADTLDLGAVVTGMTTTQSITVRNTGNMPLSITVSLRSHPARQNDIGEFTLLQRTGNLDTTTGGTFTAHLRYTAERTFLPGTKEALLAVQVQNPLTGTVLTERLYNVRIQRLPYLISSGRSILDFDSVYVGAEKSDTTLLRNTSRSLSVTLQPQARIQALTQYQSFSADALDTTRTARQYTAGAIGHITLRFRPRIPGIDSADYQLESIIDSTQGKETLSIRLRGVGVRQQFDVQSATSDSMGNAQILRPVVSFTRAGYRKFSIDIGCLRVGQTKNIRIAFQNNGNLPFGLWRQDRIFTGSPSNDSSFIILQPFSPRRSVMPGERDSSLTIQFRPRDFGVKTLEYVLFSDIKRAGRIPTAPDSVEQIIIEVRAEGIVPNIASPLRVVFPRNSLGTGCPVNSTLPIAIENPLSRMQCGTPLTYRAQLLGASGLFRLSINATQRTVLGGASDTIFATFIPQSVGVFADTLQVISDAVDSVRHIVLVGEAISQPAVSVSAGTVHAPPGSTVTLPIWVRPSTVGDRALNQSALGYVRRASFDLTYNRTLLQYIGYERTQTASVNADILIERRPSLGDDSTLRCIILARDQQLLPRSEVLLWLIFRSYLGRKPSTPLTLTNIRLSNPEDPLDCIRVRIDNEATARVSTGTFSLDSICGIQAKISSLPAGTFLLQDITPNPAAEDIRIQFSIAYPSNLSIDILDAFGQSKVLVADHSLLEGLHEITVPISHLPAGMYMCRMRAGHFHAVKKFIVIR
ncbi:MAG: T9SS type A sorting domain-containing protein [Bacteroidota bacterium]|nr:T9SS type A sorting domain-containing protein [Candidatus Kapabacteria bacterium]MDW8220120.1 T9SS type A sorting domain-containing protein [Bacteroidota bacterium]